MNQRLKVLVLGVSGNVSIGILKVLKKSGFPNIKTYGACISKNSAGFGLSDEALLCPLAFSPEFPEWLSRIENNYDIDLVISGVGEVNYVLAKIKNQQTKALYLTPEFENVRIFNDKLETVTWFNKFEIEHPVTIDLDNEEDVASFSDRIKFPAIVKPKLGKGSKGVSIIKDEKELLLFVKAGGYIAQELIGNPQSEYTCGVYKSKFGYTKVIVMRRILNNGSTALAEVVENKDIEDYCHKIASALDTTSPFNVQLRVSDSGKPLCFEINMRLSGTTSIRHNFGFKDCEAWIREQLFNQDSRGLFNIEPGIAIRYEEEVYFKNTSLDLLSEKKTTDVHGELIK
jgi:carbamoyl-phosphate synthase large subunit